MHNSIHTTAAILLATYNGAKYIGEFLDSLCAQSFQDFCIYVRDDGSTDTTLEIVSEYTSRLNIHILPSKERLGPAKGFFRIMEEAGEEHVCYLLADQDDFWYHDKVKRAVMALRNHADEVVLYCTRLEYVDEGLHHLDFSPVPRLLTLENAVVENVATGCTVAISRRARKEVLEPKPYDFIMHDWWLYMYCTAFGKVVYDLQPSIKYRQHGSNTIGAATGFLDDFRRRWKRFVKRDGGVHLLSRQVRAFLSCYGNRLKPQHRHLLNQLDAGTEHMATRLLIALHPPVSRQTRIDTFIMRFLFLIGRY
jgi:glycosyltransferase involved in cell wall biosynthesis